MPTISKSEIERIKSSVVPQTKTTTTTDPKDDSESRRRHHLKTLSDARVSKWTDTLASQHLAKLEWKKQKEIADERVRLAIDKKEAALKETARLATIDRAKRSLYERKEKVMNLRSQQLYTDVVEERDVQIREKMAREQNEREWERARHEETLACIARGDEAERDNREEKKRRDKQIAELLARQRHEGEEMRRVESRERREEEVRRIERAREEDREEMERRRREKTARRERERRVMEELRRDAAAEKENRLRRERAESDERGKVWARVESMSVARAALSRRHFDEKQKLRERLCEAACRQLHVRSDNEEALRKKYLKVNAEREKRKKEDEKRKRDELEAAIRQSRSDQMRNKEELKRKEMEEERRYCELSEAKRREEEERENRKERERKEEILRIKKEQERQIEETRKMKKQERREELDEAQKSNDLLANEDAQFRDFCAKEIERFRALGKKTHMLERAMITKDVSIRAGK